MAAFLPSTTRGKYAAVAIALFLAAAAGLIAIQQWSSDGSGLFGSGLFGSASNEANGAAGSTGFGEELTGINSVDNVLGALLGRSPGERTVGLSGKGKGPARAYRYARSPAAQALQDAFDSPVGASRVIDDRSSPAVAPGIVLPGTSAAAPPVGLVLPVFPQGGVGRGPGGGFFGPPGGFSVGGGGPGGGGGGEVPPVIPPIVPPVVPPPPVAPIPEPSTWLMLLLGMAAVGAALRSGKAKQAAASLSAL